MWLAAPGPNWTAIADTQLIFLPLVAISWLSVHNPAEGSNGGIRTEKTLPFYEECDFKN